MVNVEECRICNALCLDPLDGLCVSCFNKPHFTDEGDEID